MAARQRSMKTIGTAFLSWIITFTRKAKEPLLTFYEGFFLLVLIPTLCIIWVKMIWVIAIFINALCCQE